MIRKTVWLRRLSAIIPLFALFVVAGLTLRTSIAFRESTNLLRRSAEVELQLERMVSLLKDAETSQRGYLLTGRADFLTPYTNAVARIPAQLPSLRDHLVQLSEQDEEVARFALLMRDRIQQLAQTVALRQMGQAAEAHAFVESGQGQAKSDEIRRSAALLARELDDKVAEHQLQLRARVDTSDLLTFVIAGLAAVLLLVAALTLRHLQHLDHLVTVCAWSKTIKLGDRWVTFEEYLREQYGVEVTHGISEKEYERMMREQDDLRPPPAQQS